LRKVQEKKEQTAKLIQLLNAVSIDMDFANPILEKMGAAPMIQKQKAVQLLRRPELDLYTLSMLSPSLEKELVNYSPEVVEQAEIQVKYESYIEKEEKMAHKLQQLEYLRISENISYDDIKALSAEAIEKLKRIRPQTIGQASRISGISPADISVLMIYMDR
ncbi:MAG: tRNA uridine-5-carboxymethylaminomethyl(34) synthesis enzyme MnmG, partial [Flammeovirgaceae bacterium]|nr:tRNA uridine-5-carboxymethylaminomethyl(34) synthesis enzyme MnmG [Flammeovirgaceae bacterium]MDW8286499.1 tRNA uridine-5-carboxymethylaminomethyl(34) synthesis enzyme MnmG [Flammeovirgaceae bacterium]